jgi:hypothetical protein
MEPANIAESIKGSAPIFACAFSGVAIATSADKWPAEFHGYVVWVGLVFITLAAVWAVGGFLGLLTGWAPLRRLYGGYSLPPVKDTKELPKT